MIGVVMLMD